MLFSLSSSSSSVASCAAAAAAATELHRWIQLGVVIPFDEVKEC